MQQLLIDIHPAHPEDAPAAGDLLAATMGVSGDIAFGGGEHARAVDRLSRLFAQPGHRMSYELAQFAHCEGQVAGLLLSFSGARLDALSARMLQPMLRVFGIAGILGVIWRGLPLLLGREARSNEYYIAHIAVSPAFQRRGIGTALLAQAESLAAAGGHHKVSLIVDRENLPAGLAYDKAGFRVEKDVRQPWVPPRYHFTGYQRRVKDLNKEKA